MKIRNFNLPSMCKIIIRGDVFHLLCSNPAMCHQGVIYSVFLSYKTHHQEVSCGIFLRMDDPTSLTYIKLL